MAVRILEREMSLSERRNEARTDLLKNIDHSKMKTFHEIGRGDTLISMSNLIIYLENNGFHPRTEDLEAILRRCDHDADRALSYDEFCDLTELPGGLNNDISIIHDAPSYMDSPDRKEVKDSVKRGTPHKRSNSNDQIDSVPKENIDESWKRREEERK